nr:hypothetical protein [uncultured Cohaesibacter sp.]
MNTNSVPRVKEIQVQKAIIVIMADGKTHTNAQLKQRLKTMLPLSDFDRERANCRPNEEKWEELVNNALSQSRGSSLISKKIVKTVSHGHHKLTPWALEKKREKLR